METGTGISSESAASCSRVEFCRNAVLFGGLDAATSIGSVRFLLGSVIGIFVIFSLNDENVRVYL